MDSSLLLLFRSFKSLFMYRKAIKELIKTNIGIYFCCANVWPKSVSEIKREVTQSGKKWLIYCRIKEIVSSLIAKYIEFFFNSHNFFLPFLRLIEWKSINFYQKYTFEAKKCIAFRGENDMNFIIKESILSEFGICLSGIGLLRRTIDDKVVETRRLWTPETAGSAQSIDCFWLMASRALISADPDPSKVINYW